jgi:hypothetical protein
MRQLIILAFAVISIVACKTENNSCGQAYFGGEIINPANNHVVLHDDSSIIDTLYLDNENRFSYNIEALSPGLHSFFHGGEYQIVVLEPNDSIMLRLNTADFDESLVFTGHGSKKNNFLINLFVALENEEREIYELSKLEASEFSLAIDELLAKKRKKLNKFIEKQECSPLFTKVANRTIDYNYYTAKEIYPIRHFGPYKLREFTTLPEEFYDYRATIDYDDEDLIDFYPFYTFMFAHFDNLALTSYFEETGDSIFDRNSAVYNLNKLDLIDKKVYNPTIKNELLRRATARKFVSYTNHPEDYEKIFNSFVEKSTNEKHKEYIAKLYGTIKNLQPGNPLPDVEIVDFNNKNSTIISKVNKPTVIYFWTSAIKNHFKNSHYKVQELKEDYPDVDFISININSSKRSSIKKILLEKNFSLDNEYIFRNPEIAKSTLGLHYINRVIIVDQNGNILKSNARLFDKDFSQILNELNQ